MTKQMTSQARENSNNLIGVMKDIEHIKGDIMDLKKAISDGFESVGNQLEKNYVSRTEFENTKGDVSDLKDTIKWIVRLILGLIVTGVVVYVFNQPNIF